ncbi:MAG: hypothetical protein CMM67_01770 [Rhodospirillaceae bacterium]|nr:hypothetical protein [Rhodospirillaceae bacterium]OUT80245.1 MAG: hypothetical protein CBB83_01575 [Rhodospirillaceae bacterium TMED23]|tara:strand:+ start:13335 stop:14651 length:1317 start_codon:yes stop_codon:yes gene_type:complete
MKYFITIFFIILIIPLAVAQESKRESNYFEIAKGYTVKVKTRVAYPFRKDNRGAFRGAGFLVNKKTGWIITNAHVSSRNPAKLEVAFKDQKFVDAQLIYVDMLLDLAVISISSDKIPVNSKVASLDCDKKPVIGSPVGAFGHPFSLSFSGTRGIVSGEKYRWGRTWVQTDAPINSGNSGGPLISLETGKVIGISSATLSKSRTEGLNFAVPMIQVCKVINLLKSGMNPSPSYLPVGFAYDEDNNTELVAAVIYKRQSVAWPLQIGDRLISLANNPKLVFKNQAMLIHELRGIRGKVDVVVERNKKKKTLSIISKPRDSLMERVGVHFSGIVLALEKYRDDEEANPRGLPLIQDVARASIGRSAGVGAYEYIISLDGITMTNPNKICRFLKRIEESNKKVKLITKESGWTYRSHSKYHAYELEVSDVKLVGPSSPSECS